MDSTMIKQRLVVMSLVCIVLVSLLFINSTFSIFTTTDIDENANKYSTGNLDIEYTPSEVKFSDSRPVNINNIDEIKPYNLNIKNNGNLAYQFAVILEDTTASESINYKYIITMVDDYDIVSLDKCEDNVIKDGLVIMPGESITVSVRIWISDDIVNSEIGKSFFAKLMIDGKAISINKANDIRNENDSSIDNDINSTNDNSLNGT